MSLRFVTWSTDIRYILKLLRKKLCQIYDRVRVDLLFRTYFFTLVGLLSSEYNVKEQGFIAHVENSSHTKFTVRNDYYFFCLKRSSFTINYKKLYSRDRIILTLLLSKIRKNNECFIKKLPSELFGKIYLMLKPFN